MHYEYDQKDILLVPIMHLIGMDLLMNYIEWKKQKSMFISFSWINPVLYLQYTCIYNYKLLNTEPGSREYLIKWKEPVKNIVSFKDKSQT